MLATFQPTTASAAVDGLPQIFDPTAATGVEAVILFDLSGRDAFMNGEYQVNGDLMFMMRFGKIFPVS